MNKIEEAITEYYGERCSDYCAECVVCQAWKQYDAVVNALHGAVPFIGYEGAGAEQAVKRARSALTKLNEGKTNESASC